MNNARWDRSLPRVMLAQLAKPSFWSYVRGNLRGQPDGGRANPLQARLRRCWNGAGSRGDHPMTKTMVIDVEELGQGDARTFRGGEHGGVPVSFILDREEPGRGPALHRHPYDEVWILEEGEVSLRAGDRTLTAGPGSIVIVPAGTPHSFTNTGSTRLRMVCIHPRPWMETEWLAARGRLQPEGPTP